jgi:DHA2 family multidrug resistance protein
MLTFGIVLFGSTILLPLMVQTLLGYTALQSGLVLSPGALVIMVLMPLVGWLVSRVDARWMIVCGGVVIGYSLWLMSRFSLGVDQPTLVWARVVQGFGLAFFFVPVNTLAYAFISGPDRNAASSLMSLSRNIGASVGIALVATLLAHQSQVHQSHLAHDVSPYHSEVQQTETVLSAALGSRLGDAQADHAALAVLYAQTGAQARMLAYVDEFRWLAAGSLVLIPLVLTMRRPRHVELHME